jgi:hypothetical protein
VWRLLDKSILNAISDFFAAVAQLRELGIIRSDKYLGDLGEYICTHFYGINLASSGRQAGYDGTDADGTIQVKYHGSTTRTNIDLGDPEQYQNLLVVLGPSSLLRPTQFAGDFLVYRMSAEQVRRHKNTDKGTYSCGKVPFARKPDQVFNLTEVQNPAEPQGTG